MEEIEYTRTVVPSSMRSPYWKYFGFPSDNANNILTRQKIVCTICNAAITYNKNTSNLRTHLMSKHFEIFQSIIATVGGKKQQIGENHFHHSTIEENFMPESSTLNKRLCTELQEDVMDSLEWRSNTVSESFIINTEANGKLEEENKDDTGKLCPQLQIGNCNFINAEDNLNDSDLVEVVAHCDEDISDTKLEKGVREKAMFDLKINNEIRGEKPTDSIEILLADMAQTDLLAMDTLTGQGFCKYNQQLTGISIDEETIGRVMKVIENRFIETQQTINMLVSDLSQLEPFSLSIETYEDNSQDKVLNIYFNYLNENNIELGNILYRSCVYNCISPNIFDLMSDINIKNCSCIVVHCVGNMHATVLEFAKSHEIPVVECLESMFANCLERIYESCDLPVDFEKLCQGEVTIKSNKTNSQKSGCYYWKKFEVLQQMLESFGQQELEQWQELQSCIDYLKPLKMALDIVIDEQLPSCSLIRPIIIKLFEEHFRQIKNKPPPIIMEIQNILQKGLYERIILHNFLKEATFFDPRFRRDFVFSESVHGLKEIKSQIIKRFKSVLNIADITHSETDAVHETSANSSTNSGKYSSLKAFFKRDLHSENSEIVKNVKTDLDSELELYYTNVGLDLDQSPALWWQQSTNCYKYLSKIAKYYLCVPCCCMPRLYHLDVRQRRFILKQRKHLNQLCPTESKLWYLFYNSEICKPM